MWGQKKKYIQLALCVIVGLAVLVVLNVLVQKGGWRLDTTKTGRHSLSGQTQKVLGQLDQEVKALCFYLPRQKGRKEAKSLLELFSRQSTNFDYEFIDPDRRNLLAEEYKVRQSGEVVLTTAGNRQEKINLPDEQKLTNAIIRLTRESSGKFYFLQGHGELSYKPNNDRSSSDVKRILAKQGIKSAPLVLAQKKKIPKDATGVVIAGPTTDLLDFELDILGRYVESGGRLFLALHAEAPSNLSGWLEKHFAVDVQKGLIVDPMSRMLGVGDELTPVCQDYPFSAWGKGFSLMTVYPTSCALSSVENGQKKTQPVVRTTKGAWLETDIQALQQGKAQFDREVDVPGPLWIGAALETSGKKNDGNGTRVLAFADENFLSNQFVNYAGNRDFLTNCFNWLNSREDLVSISKKKDGNSLLFLSWWQQKVITWVPIALIPGLCLAVALFVGWRRKREK